MTPLDLIGIILDAPASEDGESTPLEGWHVNTTSAALIERPALSAFVVTPSRLRRVWAGDDPSNPVLTVALRFVDEAQARGALAGLWPAPSPEDGP
jgi:hypothetical protein